MFHPAWDNCADADAADDDDDDDEGNQSDDSEWLYANCQFWMDFKISNILRKFNNESSLTFPMPKLVGGFHRTCDENEKQSFGYAMAASANNSNNATHHLFKV